MKVKFDFSERWSKSLQKQTVTCPIVGHQNMIFVCTKSKSISRPEHTAMAISSSSGEIEWKQSFSDQSISGSCLYTPSQRKRPLFILALTSNDYLNGSGEVIAFNLAGKTEWSLKIPDSVVSAPRVSMHNLLLTDGGDSLSVIDLKTQTLKHHHQFDVKASLAAVSTRNTAVYIPCKSNNLLAIKKTTGKQIWKYSPPTEYFDTNREWLDKSPIATRDFIFASSTKGRVICLDSKHGTLVWSTNIELRKPLGQPALGEHALYIGGSNGVYAISKNNGEILWHHKTARRVSTSPKLDRDLVFATCEDHFIYVLHNKSGKLLAKFEMARRIDLPIHLSSGHIFLVDREATLKAFHYPALNSSTPPKDDDSQLAKGLIKSLKTIQSYRALSDFPKLALELEEYAKAISKSSVWPYEKAIAWQRAADAFKESGNSEKRKDCKVEIARNLKEPLFDLEVKEDVLVLNSWSKLRYTLKNVGFGIARSVGVVIKGDNNLFEWKFNPPTTSNSLPQNQTYTGSFNIKPLNAGDSVPLELQIDYLDWANKLQTFDHSLSIRVVSSQAEINLLVPTKKFNGRNIAKSPTELHTKMVEAFSRDELDDIIFELEFKTDDFTRSRTVATRELIDTTIRHGKMDSLLNIIIQKREHLAKN